MATSNPSIPATQKAAVLRDVKKDYKIESDFPVTQPRDLKPGQCLIKLEYTGVCHSDLHVKNADWAAKPALPVVGGHEGVGTVVAIGEHTNYPAVKIGDRVGVKWIGGVCETCEFCLRGHESACRVSKQLSHGFQIHGTFQQYVVSYTNYVTPIPDGLDSAAAAPILCAGMTVYKALRQANLSVGQWVAITGAGGGLGHLAIQYAIASGYRVVAIDTGEHKKQLALSLGAEKWVDFKESKDIIADVQAATDGLGPHAAIIAVGEVQPFAQAAMYLRMTGTLVAVGMPAGAAPLNIPVPVIIGKSLRIVGSAIATRYEVQEALDLAARGKVRCRFEVRDFESINQVLRELEEGKIAGRIVVKL